MQSTGMGEDKEAISADFFLISSELSACSTPTLTLTPAAERRLRPPQEEPLRCPRCDSANTKFCYYNNYSLSQPRYFCKSCRRYWTKGGSLRNVPVGGGCRRNKRYRPTSAAILAAATVQHHRPQPALPLADLKPVQLPNYSTSNGSLNVMDCSYNSNGLNLVMNNCKHGLGDMNTLGLCMDGSRETLMEDPCQKLKFFLDDECIDPGMKPGEGSWNDILSVGWQESIGYSDDHGSLSSSWARI